MSAADRALNPAPEVLRAVFDSLGVGVYVTDGSGHITAANPRACELVGRSEEDTNGHDLHDLLHCQADGRALSRDECGFLEVFDNGRPTEGSDDFFLRGDGSTVPVIWVATPLWREGRVDGAVVAFHDFGLHREAARQTAAHLAALEELAERLSVVAEVSAVLTSTLDVPEMLTRLFRVLVPDLGDWAAVDLRIPGETVRMRRIAVRTRYGMAESLMRTLPEASSSALTQAMSGGRPLRLDADTLTRNMGTPLGEAHQALFDRLGGHSAVVAPLSTRRELFGVLTVARTGERTPCDEAMVLILSDVGRRVGLMMDNAQLFEQQRHVAETMQRQLLTPLPQVDHLRLAARYLPAQRAAEIGGDWYDAFLLADGVMTLVIGDVVGHDLQAAAHMAEVRNMLRALAWDRQRPPSEVMHQLDEVMTNTSDASMATAIFSRIEGPDGGPWQLHWVNAGHPPPLLVTADGHARFLEEGHGPLLGLNASLHLGLEWSDAYENLPPRSTVLLYTDGLVENRNSSIDVGLDRLRHHAAELAGHDLEDFCDEILKRIAPSGDDVALLALRLPEAGEGAGGDEAPHLHAHNPAAPNRDAPGTAVEGTPVRDTSDSV